MIPNTKEPMRIQFDQHQCDLPPADLDRLRERLDSLARQVEDFPIADVHVLVEGNARSNDYSVKLTLILPGETLVGNDHDQAPLTALDRCLASLEDSLRAYKDRMGQVPERQKRQKGTHQDLEPTTLPDPAALDAAIGAGDYPAFRAATLGYEEALRKRVGRWVERYPDVQGQIDHGLKIADIVEEVFLLAFEGYDSRPHDLRLGDWLVALIDPAVKALQQNPDEELENIHLVRSARAAAAGPEAV